MIEILIPPIIGGAIGYITNGIAIKMLFRPRRAVFIGKFQLPFTPGLIPKEKHRVAKSMGEAISTQLLSSDVIIDEITSDEVLQKMEISLNKIVNDNKNNYKTLATTLEDVLSVDTYIKIKYEIKESLCSSIEEKLKSGNYGEVLSQVVMGKLSGEKTKVSFITNFLDDNILQSIKKELAKIINKIIQENSYEIVNKTIDNEFENLLNMKISEIIEKNELKIPNYIQSILSVYKKAVRDNLPEILRKLNIGKIVEDRISDFDAKQIEDLIFGIMKKEMNAICYLGAILGFLMGIINIFI